MGLSAAGDELVGSGGGGGGGGPSSGVKDSYNGAGRHRRRSSEGVQRGGGGGGSAGADVRTGNIINNGNINGSGNVGGGGSGGCSGSETEACATVARELPAFLAEVVSLSGSLRALAACRTVHRTWWKALGGDRGKALFGSIVRNSGVPPTLRPAVWQMLVLRTAKAGAGVRGGGGGGGGGECEVVAVHW